MSKEPLRILVLTSRTGGGHDARADAFEAWCGQLYDGDVEVRIERRAESMQERQRPIRASLGAPGLARHSVVRMARTKIRSTAPAICGL